MGKPRAGLFSTKVRVLVKFNRLDLETKLKNQQNPNICLSLKSGGLDKSQLFLQRGRELDRIALSVSDRFREINSLHLDASTRSDSSNLALINSFLTPLSLDMIILSNQKVICGLIE